MHSIHNQIISWNSIPLRLPRPKKRTYDQWQWCRSSPSNNWCPRLINRSVAGLFSLVQLMVRVSCQLIQSRDVSCKWCEYITTRVNFRWCIRGAAVAKPVEHNKQGKCGVMGMSKKTWDEYGELWLGLTRHGWLGYCRKSSSSWRTREFLRGSVWWSGIIGERMVLSEFMEEQQITVVLIVPPPPPRPVLTYKTIESVKDSFWQIRFTARCWSALCIWRCAPWLVVVVVGEEKSQTDSQAHKNETMGKWERRRSHLFAEWWLQFAEKIPCSVTRSPGNVVSVAQLNSPADRQDSIILSLFFFPNLNRWRVFLFL